MIDRSKCARRGLRESLEEFTLRIALAFPTYTLRQISDIWRVEGARLLGVGLPFSSCPTSNGPAEVEADPGDPRPWADAIRYGEPYGETQFGSVEDDCYV